MANVERYALERLDSEKVGGWVVWEETRVDGEVEFRFVLKKGAMNRKCGGLGSDLECDADNLAAKWT